MGFEHQTPRADNEVTTNRNLRTRNHLKTQIIHQLVPFSRRIFRNKIDSFVSAHRVHAKIFLSI